MNNTELLPCPFCGSKDIGGISYTASPAEVHCYGCDALITGKGTEATTKWNTRADKASAVGDDIAVNKFANVMKDKLAQKRKEGRGGWQDMSADELSAMLHNHVLKGDPVDVANFCMMLWNNGQSISKPKQSAPVERIDGLDKSLLALVGKEQFSWTMLQMLVNGRSSHVLKIVEAARAYLKLQRGD